MTDVESPQGMQQPAGQEERLNISYFKQRDGIIKITEAVSTEYFGQKQRTLPSHRVEFNLAIENWTISILYRGFMSHPDLTVSVNV